jgi:hypothetical protein
VNRDIVEQEVISAVIESCDSSPGPDGIGYCIFKKFQKSGFSLLTHLFNLFFIWSLSKTIESQSSTRSSQVDFGRVSSNYFEQCSAEDV